MRRRIKPRKNSKRRRKGVLRLPDLEHAKSAVLRSLTNSDAQRGYNHAIDEFVDWYGSEPRLAFNRVVVLRYRSHLESRRLAPGTINLRLGAVRRLAYEAADCGLLSADLAAGIRRVHGVRKFGVRLGNWLSAEESKTLWQAPDPTRMKGKRDRALLSLLLACGLRRHEAVALRLRDLDNGKVVGPLWIWSGKAATSAPFRFLSGSENSLNVGSWQRELMRDAYSDEWISSAMCMEIKSRSKQSGTSLRNRLEEPVCPKSRRTICAEHVHVYVSLQVVNWNRFSFCLGMFPYRPPSGISEAGSGFAALSTTE
jgi:site-specific recombinase XerC